MKRDPELIRDILLKVEDQHDGTSALQIDLEEDPDFTFEGHSPDEVFYHFRLLDDAEFFLSVDFRRGNFVLLDGISWKGHEFLANAKNDTFWQRAMQRIMQKGGSASIAILQSLLVEIAKQQLLGG